MGTPSKSAAAAVAAADGAAAAVAVIVGVVARGLRNMNVLLFRALANPGTPTSSPRPFSATLGRVDDAAVAPDADRGPPFGNGRLSLSKMGLPLESNTPSKRSESTLATRTCLLFGLCDDAEAGDAAESSTLWWWWCSTHDEFPPGLLTCFTCLNSNHIMSPYSKSL